MADWCSPSDGLANPSNAVIASCSRPKQSQGKPWRYAAWKVAARLATARQSPNKPFGSSKRLAHKTQSKGESASGSDFAHLQTHGMAKIAITNRRSATPGTELRLLDVSEHEMKRVVLNRKNSLFVGNPRGGRTAAILASLTSTCRRHDIDPQIYLAQLLVNLPAARMADLPAWLPDRWKLAQKATLGHLQSHTPQAS